MSLLKRLLILLCTYSLAILLILTLFKSWGIYRFNIEKPVQGQIEPIAGIIKGLIACESGGNEHAIHYNDGAIGLHSRGILQFQRPTFELYWRSLVNSDVDSYDISNLYTDPIAQKLLASVMIETNRNNLRHWKICSTRLGLL